MYQAEGVIFNLMYHTAFEGILEKNISIKKHGYKEIELISDVVKTYSCKLR